MGIARFLALAVILAGITVIIGWIFKVPVLLSIRPGWMNMKFNTAIAFVLSGVILYFITHSKEGGFDKAQVIIPLASLVIFLLIGTSFFSAIFGIRTGVENLFIEDAHPTLLTIVPGRPSMPAMLSFILIASAGILAVSGDKKMRLKLKLIGLIVAVIGAVAVVGYILNLPFLYYYIKDFSSAIALHTAVLLILLGAGLACQ